MFLFHFDGLKERLEVTLAKALCAVALLYPIMTLTNKGTTTPVAGPPGAAYTDAFNSSLGTSFSCVVSMLGGEPLSSR